MIRITNNISQGRYIHYTVEGMVFKVWIDAYGYIDLPINEEYVIKGAHDRALDHMYEHTGKSFINREKTKVTVQEAILFEYTINVREESFKVTQVRVLGKS